MLNKYALVLTSIKGIGVKTFSYLIPEQMKQIIQIDINRQEKDEYTDMKMWEMGSNKRILHKENENCRKY